jgi:putative PIN family toxin of toxin-antitoxin system
MKIRERVVFDCNVLFQALVSPTGPARRLFMGVTSSDLVLFISAHVVDELADVAAWPHIVKKYGINANAVAEFVNEIKKHATFVDDVPHVFDFPRDPKDAHYVDLAVAASAKLIVSRDKDLLSLADVTTPEGQDFRIRFPDIEILTPPALLRMLEERGQG